MSYSKTCYKNFEGILVDWRKKYCMKYDFDLEDHRKKHKRIIFNILITVVEAAIAVFAAYAITHYGLEKMQVSGDYMNPTLKDGDKILINKMSYMVLSVKRNDVVVIQQNGSEHNYYTIARVLGLPGETIQIKDGYLYINGDKLEEKYNFPVMENGGLALEDVILDTDEYFVLCDNRNESEDSRNANTGNKIKKDIIGKAWLRTNSLALISNINEFKEKPDNP
mgnify:CR=1 FL=1